MFRAFRMGVKEYITLTDGACGLTDQGEQDKCRMSGTTGAGLGLCGAGEGT